jgi:hypothetical protein
MQATRPSQMLSLSTLLGSPAALGQPTGTGAAVSDAPALLLATTLSGTCPLPHVQSAHCGS